MAASEIKPLPH